MVCKPSINYKDIPLVGALHVDCQYCYPKAPPHKSEQLFALAHKSIQPLDPAHSPTSIIIHRYTMAGWVPFMLKYPQAPAHKTKKPLLTS